jgi:hypothetical protein
VERFSYGRMMDERETRLRVEGAATAGGATVLYQCQRAPEPVPSVVSGGCDGGLAPQCSGASVTAVVQLPEPTEGRTGTAVADGAPQRGVSALGQG